MILEQEHIIHKVILEVETNSTKVAHNLKNHLGMFLKDEILPYLENYFKSIEQKLPAEIVQIPQLTLEINTNSQDHFTSLKTDTKEKLVEKIATLLKAPNKSSQEVILINTQEHQTRSLLFFIENGYTPWWKTANNTTQFTQEEIVKTASNSSFSNKYIQLLNQPICKKRCIQQFTDVELQALLKATFKHTKEVKILQDDFIKLFSQLSTVSRDFIWHEIITYLLSKNITICIEKLASVLIQSTPAQNDTVYAFAKAVLTFIKQGFKIAKTNTITALQVEKSNILQVQESLISQLMTVFNTIRLSKEATIILQPALQNNTYHIRDLKEGKQNNNETVTSDEASLLTIKNEISRVENQEVKAFNQDNDNEQVTPISEKESTLKRKNNNLLEQKNIPENKNTLGNNTASEKKNALEKNHTSNQGHTTIPNQEKSTHTEKLKSSSQDSKTLINTTVVKEEKKEKKETQSNSSKKENMPNNVSQKPTQEENKREASKVASKNVLQQQYQEFKNQFDQKHKDSTTIDTYIKEITSQQEEVFMTNTGSYHIPNAGLIILHPYLKPFFQDCGIVDDASTLIDPEMAVHTLHYLATKKEQQLESQMLFEKFLCGIPLKTPIQRQVQLPDTIKQQAEELLESVVENWGVLNNASPDLVRYEFLQRAGKLSFKEDNPKIVIERKTQDILVDKLPWGIGICRLPWFDHLIYTNW